LYQDGANFAVKRENACPDMSFIGSIFVGGAYLLGLLTGWFAWRARRSDQKNQQAGETAMTPDQQTKLVPDAVSASTKLEALAEEIKNAKVMLHAESEEREELAAAVASLEEALKRANGRLKLILKSVKRAKSGE
jgi:predicted  nucleic acid-binding Zn-ribbon protein